MKKLLLVFSLLVCMFSSSKAQNLVIPDTIFRNYLLTNPAINTNGDTSITVAEAAAFTDTLFLWHYHVLTLSGIENFINITGLDCEGECCGIIGLLRDLDVTHCTKLKFLNCFNNQLHSLDLSHNTALQVLNTESNPLGELDLSNNLLLKELYCSSDSLTSINVSGDLQLEQFHCINNYLSSLDVTHNSNLKTLYCSNNPLVSFDVTHNSALEELLCVSDNLTSLNVSKNLLLNYFYCFTNPSLTSICVNSISDADTLQSESAFMKDSTSAWSEACKMAGITENTNKLSITISPNPSRGQFSFNGLKSGSTIEIFDIAGRSVYKTFTNDSSVITDLSEKDKGIYTYKIIDIDQKAVFGKLILQ